MANKSTLKPFTKENQPSGESKSRRGVPNRATIFKKWLSVKTDVVNPATGDTQKGTVQDEVVLSLITEAKKGDVKAIALILDSLYGKIVDKADITSDGKEIKTVTFQIQGNGINKE